MAELLLIYRGLSNNVPTPAVSDLRRGLKIAALRRDITDLMRQVEPEDLIKFGLIPEFVGRLPVLATLDELNEEALMQILTEPKNALIKQFQKLFSLEGVELEFREKALEAIAKQAIKRKSGARGLRSIVENKLLDVMYELPALTGLQKVVVDENVVNKDATPLYIYEQKKCA